MIQLPKEGRIGFGLGSGRETDRLSRTNVNLRNIEEAAESETEIFVLIPPS